MLGCLLGYSRRPCLRGEWAFRRPASARHGHQSDLVYEITYIKIEPIVSYHQRALIIVFDRELMRTCCYKSGNMFSLCHLQSDVPFESRRHAMRYQNFQPHAVMLACYMLNEAADEPNYRGMP